MSLVIVSSDRFADHLMPPGHPERVARAGVMQAVAAKHASQGVSVLAPRPATREELLRVHAPAYLDGIAAAAGRAVMLDADTFTSPDTAEVAALAAGASIVAVDAVLQGQVGPFDSLSLAQGRQVGRVGQGGTPDTGHRTPDGSTRSALVLVRPPGHHAEAARAMGFCIYNNIAIAAAHALARGLTRVAIVDYDVHHGNGTQWAFYRDPRVLFVSTHQFPFYPGTGAAGEAGVEQGEGFTLNVPLEAGATDGDYLMVFDGVVLPVLAAFRPELLLVSAGFDGHMRDPLAQMRVSVAGFNQLAARLHAFAASIGCPAVFITEGGYHLKALGACLDGLACVLRGLPVTETPGDELRSAVASGPSPGAEPLSADAAPLVEDAPRESTRRGPAAIDLVRSVQTRYWPGL